MSPNSECFKELLTLIDKNKEVITHLGFNSLKSLEEYVMDNGYFEFSELRSEIQDYIKNCIK
jgi:hypothetical protein